MNWLDILLIVIIVILTLGAIICQFICASEYEYGAIAGIFVLWLIIIGIINLCAWFNLDKKSGSTVGTITSVDKNFFGTTALYIKTTETNEEKYCIEFNENLENKAKELIGKKVKISYGKRVGFYSTGKCHQAPVETIEEIENEENN